MLTRVLTSASVVAAVLLPVGWSTATADERPTVAAVQAQLEELDQQAASTAEALKGTQALIAEVSDRIADTKAQIAAATEAQTSSTRTLDQLASDTYTTGGSELLLDLLTADSPEQFLHQIATLDELQSSQQNRFDAATNSAADLVARRAELQSDLAITASAAQAASDQRSAIALQIAQGQSLIAQLRADERARVAALEEARRQASLAAAAQAQANVSVSATGPARVAIDYALAQVGKPYSFAAKPPMSWDCSKLTAAAWAQAGVSLTAYSQTQWEQTDRVDVDALQPGDLLFYFNLGAHHVVIYIGNGMAVSASNPGRGVEVLTDPFGGWYGPRFSGIGRVRLP